MNEALYRHSCVVYEAMAADSKEIDGHIVWEGFLTHLFRDLEFSMPRYSQVMKCLKDMGCVVQLQRGGGAGASQWQLLHAPDPEEYEKTGTTARQKAAMRDEIRAQRERDLVDRLSKLEQRVAVLESA